MTLFAGKLCAPIFDLCLQYRACLLQECPAFPLPPHLLLQSSGLFVLIVCPFTELITHRAVSAYGSCRRTGLVLSQCTATQPHHGCA
jgi:hypothetical protein